MKLGQSTLTDDERRTEAKTLLLALESVLEELNNGERKFVNSMITNFAKYEDKTSVSPQQLFWLRDLVSKY